MESYIEAVSLDLDGTLICVKPAEEIISDFLEKKGIRIDTESVREKLRNINLYKKEILKNYRNAVDYYIRLNYAILSSLNVRSWKLAAELLKRWFDKGNFKVYDDVVYFFTHIKALGLKIIILSNNLSKEVVKILKMVNIENLVDAIATPDLSGFFKPNPEAFKYAAKSLEVSPDKVIHIGDSLEEDYEGALRSGMRALLVVRRSTPPAGVRYVRNLYEAYKEVLAFEHLGKS